MLSSMWSRTFCREMLLSIILVLLSSAVNFGTSCCAKKERMSSFLDAAIDLISKAKLENVTCLEDHDFIYGKALDCADLYRRGYNKSGVYTIWPINRLTLNKPIDVYCDMTTEGGGWTVIQRRGNFGRADDYFGQDWGSYKKGFGDLERDFWFGNDNIFAMTNQRLYSARFDLEDKLGNRAFANYDSFWIDDEFNSYTLHISGYRGTAGDAMKKHNNLKFSAKGQDNRYKCAEIFKSGWWFENCYEANLNGRYNTQHGINWHPFRNKEFLPRAEIKIRPSVFQNMMNFI